MDTTTDISVFFNRLLTEDYFLLFLVIAAGVALGNISIRGFRFGMSAVIFAALFFGWAFGELGIPVGLPSVIENTGLVLFIYTIGMQAGPSFFDAFRMQGKKLVLLTTVIMFTAAGLTLAAEYFLKINNILGAGLFSGALTSTPGLAAAVEAAARTGADNASDASVAYGIAYPLGVVAVILFANFAPRLFRIDIKSEEGRYAHEMSSRNPPLEGQNLVITNANVDGKTLKDLDFRTMTGANVSRIVRQDGEMIPPESDVVLHTGDILRVVGTDCALRRAEVLIGEKTDREIPSSGQIEVRWYLVTRKDVVNKTIAELNLIENYKATVVRIRRAGVETAPYPSSLIRYGDKLLVSSSKGNVKGLTDLFGDSLKQFSSTSFLPIGLGIVLGIFLGKISIPLFGTQFSLGLTGGTLLVAILLSYIGKTGPVIWTLPGQANQLLRQFGLLMFLTPIGLKAGGNIAEILANDNAFMLLGLGLAITLIPMLVATAVGYYGLKMNFLTLMGGIMGSMTSTPGLSSVDAMSDIDAAQVAYATVYPFALVWLILISQLLVSI